ncbi:hypothetical protein [Demequina sp. NBRC 110051]|uniref:hypothetical protein n=1 Tax=Demequina sp. NBRC 110051 TaxID=1570340 RepID=UPI000A028400|nr:hypothetical protein [Demequina sp. NBRC 110051]
MFTLMSIHHPRPEHRDALIASMHRYGDALRGREGLISVHTLADDDSDRLVGLAIFVDREAYERLAPAARAAVAEDPFEVWEEHPIDGLRLTEV